MTSSHHITLRIIIFLLLSNIDVFSQALGERAPKISPITWIDSNEQDSILNSGKIIILDFWFTNCAPCVYTIPHLNSLSQKYKDDNVLFIAISFEDTDKLLNFMSQKKILALVGSDTSYHVTNNFDVKSYPTTFLIDEEGVLKWKGYPSHLSSDMIDFLVDKKSYPQLIDISDKTQLFDNIENIHNENIYPINVTINNYMQGSGMKHNSREVSIVNQSLNEIMSYLLKTSSSRIISADTNKYDVHFKIPNSLPQKNVKSEIISSLMNELNYQILTEKTEIEGYELKILNDSLFVRNAIDTTKNYYGLSTSVKDLYWLGDGAQIPDLIRELENQFDLLINNGTYINGYFKFRFPLTNLDEAESFLLEQYGLVLVSKTFEINLVYIKK